MNATLKRPSARRPGHHPRAPIEDEFTLASLSAVSTEFRTRILLQPSPTATGAVPARELASSGRREARIAARAQARSATRHAVLLAAALLTAGYTAYFALIG